jgi:hypothetical protein
MPTGADSDPKQLLTYSPNFNFRKFSATGETNRIRNMTLHWITNSAQFGTTSDYTRITLLMWFPQYCVRPPHMDVLQPATVYPAFRQICVNRQDCSGLVDSSVHLGVLKHYKLYRQGTRRTSVPTLVTNLGRDSATFVFGLTRREENGLHPRR